MISAGCVLQCGQLMMAPGAPDREDMVCFIKDTCLIIIQGQIIWTNTSRQMRLSYFGDPNEVNPNHIHIQRRSGKSMCFEIHVRAYQR